MRQTLSDIVEIGFSAAPELRAVIASIGRTEDVRFSPAGRRLAVAAFRRSRVVVFDIDISSSALGRQIVLTGVVEVSSPALDRPHGLDFIDEETLVVANREGNVTLFRLPLASADVRQVEVLPVQTLPVGDKRLLNAPGSVCVTRLEQDLYEILVCNNRGHSLTRHVLDAGVNHLVSSNEVLLRKWLDIPDGVAVSPDRRWLAVSNHNTHNVFLYENSPALNPDCDPVCILRQVYYPHGLCFSADSRSLYVADAGAPHLLVYTSDGCGWRGVRNPTATFRIMEESMFLQGHLNPQEGGPKGIDIDVGSGVLVVTSQFQPLAFFDLAAMQAGVGVGSHDEEDSPLAGHPSGIRGEPSAQLPSDQRAAEVAYELHVMTQARAALDDLTNSMSWRVTAPLRGLVQAVKRRVRQGTGADPDQG